MLHQYVIFLFDWTRDYSVISKLTRGIPENSTYVRSPQHIPISPVSCLVEKKNTSKGITLFSTKTKDLRPSTIHSSFPDLLCSCCNCSIKASPITAGRKYGKTIPKCHDWLKSYYKKYVSKLVLHLLSILFLIQLESKLSHLQWTKTSLVSMEMVRRLIWS